MLNKGVISKKNLTICFAMILLFATCFTYADIMPITNAHTPPWNIPSYAYLIPSPNPVGIGQKVAIVMWVDTPLPSAAVTNDIRRHDYTLTITKPDGTVVTEHWDVVSDSTSIQYYQYTPDQAGNYTIFFAYDGQTYTWDVTGTVYGDTSSTSYKGDYFMPVNKTVSLTVQQEQLPNPLTSYPLPQEYWTRPIEGQNTDWWSISSNWLGSPYIEGGSGVSGAVQPDGLAPNSAHVMWSKSIQDGGVVGGSLYEPIGKTYYMGGSYNVRFSNALIMYGRLYYSEPFGNSGGGGDYLCVDLRTGEEIWRINTTATGISLVPSFGYLYSYDTGNQHGVLPNGILVATYSVGGTMSPYGPMGGITCWAAYDPRTGVLTPMNITNVPGGTAAVGPQGEILRYSITNYGTASKPNWKLSQWNSSNILTPGAIGGGLPGQPAQAWYTGTANASLPGCYDYNVSVTLGPGSWSISRLAYDKIALLTQGSFGARGNWNGVNVTAINMKSGSEGQVLWTKYYAAAPGNVSRSIVAWDPDNGVFIVEDKETMVHYAYSLADGNLIWGPTPPANDYNYFRQNTYAAYGMMYFGGYGGELYARDIKNGTLLWTYGNGGPGNSTNSGLTTAWGSYPIFIDVIANGKIYLAGTEHSPNSPFYKGTRYRCVDAYTGQELWTLLGWGTGMDANYDRVADGYLAFLNCYDMKVYSVGKGPSAMTVNASPKAQTYGSSIVIDGSITDISAGTKQSEQAARFPNGVPAVSDQSMGPWMEYVYMQKPRPTDTTGVPITVSVVDSNGNYREIGNTTSDADGYFSFPWQPDISGQYIVYASFGGSESFWPSRAVTSFMVDEQPTATSTSQAVTLNPPTEMYIAVAAAAMIIAIAIGFAVTIVTLKKKP